MARKLVNLIMLTAAYLSLAFFVYYAINPLCYSFFQHPAFVVTTDFFYSKIGAIGGLSDYLQTFIDQFTMFRFWGTFMLVAELLLTAFLVSRYVRKTMGENRYAGFLVWLLPVAVAFVAWSDIKYSFAINMQVLLLAAVLNLHQALSKYDWNKFVTPLLAIAIYHACGPVALYTFSACIIIDFAFNRDKSKIISVVGAVVVAAVWPLLVYKFMLPVKPNAAFYDMRPQKLMFTSFKLSAVLYAPLICLPVSMFLGYAYNIITSERGKQLITNALFVLIVVCTVFSQLKHDKRAERMGFKMEVAAYNNDWNNIIGLVKNNKWLCEVENYDRQVNFYYNLALAETNQLADKIFTYPQILGMEGLFLDRPIATNVCFPVSMFYYKVGFITSALHFAFEAQSTYTDSHYLMRMVIDCLIIIGDYDTALIFLNKYCQTMFSKRYSVDRMAFIVGGFETEFEKQNIDEIRQNHPKKEFYISGQQNNMLQVLLANRKNRIADQYLTCSALLQNDLDLFIDLISNGYSNVNYNNLPRAYQEAVLLYKALNKNVNPEIERFNIQSYIVNRMLSFQQIVNAKPSNINDVVKTKFANTYWKYYFLDSPKVTGVSLK